MLKLHGLPLALALLVALSCSSSEAARMSLGRQLWQASLPQFGDVPVCGAGAFFDLTTSQCQACPIGSYQDKDKDSATQCELCGIDKTTCCTGSTTSGACLPIDGPRRCPPVCPSAARTGPNGVATPFEGQICPQGYFKEPPVYGSSAGSNGCAPCPTGTYQDRENQATECIPCRAGTNNCCTKNEGRDTCETDIFRNPSQCPQPASCSPEPVLCAYGHFFDVVSGRCTPCPIGSFNDNPTAQSCSMCGSDETTCCTGAIVSSQCVKLAEVAPLGDKCMYKCPFSAPF